MKTAVVAGCRTPFARSGTILRDLSAVELGKVAVRELLARADLPGEAVDHLIMGTVIHDPHAGNLAREIGLRVLPKNVPASTVSRACASANQAIADGVGLIELGYADVVVAGGAESLSRIPITVSDNLAQALMKAAKAKSLKERVGTFSGIRPRDLVPEQPAIAEPTTGETMGEAAERMAKENGIAREAQDEWALRSHRLAAAGVEDGRIGAEVCPLYVPPDFSDVVESDNLIRTDTSLEALAKLRPVFDR
jgi:acetyl-CoA acyltransferase